MISSTTDTSEHLFPLSPPTLHSSFSQYPIFTFLSLSLFKLPLLSNSLESLDLSKPIFYFLVSSNPEERERESQKGKRRGAGVKRDGLEVFQRMGEGVEGGRRN